MLVALFFPFILQAIVIGIDEGYFHIKRGLPKWERIGHPLDTLTVILCFVFVFAVPYSAAMIKWYAAMALFSCLMVTKDEFVHKHHCPASEQWLHALLFINHPIMLASLGWLWPKVYEPAVFTFLIIQTFLISAFFLYQVIYWNFIWQEKT